MTIPCGTTPPETPQLCQFQIVNSLARLSVLVFSKLITNRNEFEKKFFMKKLRLVNTFPTPYHLFRSDKRLKNNNQKTVRRKLKFKKQN